MSQEHVDKTRAFIENYNRRDFDAAVRDFHEDVDFVLPEMQKSDSCRGREEVIRFWEGLDDTFTELRLDPQEHVDGGNRVATRLRYYGRGKVSGVEVETEMYHQVFFFEDGVIVRMEYFTTWEEARSTAISD